MENKYINWLVFLFAAALIGGFAYFMMLPQGTKPSWQPPVNTNTTPVQPVVTDPVQALAQATKLNKFSSLDELKKFLSENLTSSSGGGIMAVDKAIAPGMAPGGTGELSNPVAGTAPSALPQDFVGFSGQAVRSGGSADYSQTNVQVQGVDEADLVKTDGKYMYVVSQNNVFILDAYPAADSKILAKIEFKSQPSNIYINDNKLVVYGYDSLIYQTDVFKRLRPQSQFMFFKIFDVTDPKNPKQVRDLDIEGNYLNSRMIGDYVYLLSSKYSYDIYGDTRPLPVIIENGSTVLNDPAASGYRFPNVYYFNMPYSGYNLTTVNAINLKDPGTKLTTETYLLDSNQKLYVSEQALYLTYTKYVREDELVYQVVKDILLPKLSDANQQRIKEIEATQNYILTPDEKFNKISVIIEAYITSLADEDQKTLQDQIMTRVKERYIEIQKQLEKTVIHKIAINNGTLDYKGFGEVQGYVLNQYSMDEQNGYFRIATTRSRSWSPYATDQSNKSYSNIYVLDGSMKVVGSVENLAEGEQIYAVRFMQNRAYLVTFKQTDPFFTVDLSDPNNPKVLGELKMPGFSTYLHPYDDTTIIGLGRETTENQYGGVIQKGVKVSLIDVSDIANPKEKASFVVPDASSYSIALDDPKAFLFSKDKNLLVIPITDQNYGGPVPMMGGRLESSPQIGIVPPIKFPTTSFNGAYVFTITKDKIDLKGKISHPQNTASGPYYGGYYESGVKRSLYIDDTLYTVSDVAVKMNALLDLKEVKNLELKKEPANKDDFIIVN